MSQTKISSSWRIFFKRSRSTWKHKKGGKPYLTFAKTAQNSNNILVTSSLKKQNTKPFLKKRFKKIIQNPMHDSNNISLLVLWVCSTTLLFLLNRWFSLRKRGNNVVWGEILLENFMQKRLMWLYSDFLDPTGFKVKKTLRMKMTCEGRGRVLAKKVTQTHKNGGVKKDWTSGPWCVRVTLPLLSIRVLL